VLEALLHSAYRALAKSELKYVPSQPTILQDDFRQNLFRLLLQLS
jgi:hypothetical protein